MAYKQPRVPSLRSGQGMTAFLHELVLFLRDHCMAAWKADLQKDEQIKALEQRVRDLEQQ